MHWELFSLSLLYEDRSTTRSSEDIIELTLAQSFIPQKHINWGICITGEISC